MNSLLKTIIFSLSFILVNGNAIGAIEKREYDISVAGFNIGEMIATREAYDVDFTRYTISSRVSFWFFVRINVKYTVTSVYKKDHLLTSHVTTNSNKGNFSSTIQWSADHYKVKVDGYKYKNDVSISDTITNNSARMYFENPGLNGNVLADNYGLLVGTENPEPDVYGVIVQGNRNRFFFSRGKVVRAIMHHPIKNFEVTLKEGHDF